MEIHPKAVTIFLVVKRPTNSPTMPDTESCNQIPQSPQNQTIHCLSIPSRTTNDVINYEMKLFSNLSQLWLKFGHKELKHSLCKITSSQLSWPLMVAIMTTWLTLTIGRKLFHLFPIIHFPLLSPVLCQCWRFGCT